LARRAGKIKNKKENWEEWEKGGEKRKKKKKEERMGKSTYTFEAKDAQSSAQARGSDLRVHFKNTREAARAINGMGLKKAQRFLKDVIDKKQIVPFRIHRRGGGRHAQMKSWKASTARWPEKSCRFLLNLLQNVSANANTKNLDLDNLEIQHIQVQMAAKGRRRTYRAHGRINPFMNCPCHIEVVVGEKSSAVSRPDDVDVADAPARPQRTANRRKIAAQRNRAALFLKSE
jgi:large subunit ribosomal protein L17e